MQKWLFWFLRFDAPDEMLEMELNRLYFRFSLIDEATIDGDVEKKCYEHLQTCFKVLPNQWNEKTWDDAYRIEKQIAMLLRGDFLHQEIKARLREAVSRNARDADDLQSDYNTLRKAIEEKHIANGDELLRNLLREILENIHWNSKLKYLRRKLRLEATRNMLLLVMIALVCALVIYSQVLSYASQFPILVLLMVGTCGLLGAMFGRLIKLHSQWDVISLEELRYWKALHYILLRSSIGVCGALIVYFFLQSQTVKGAIFPQLDGLPSEVKDIALLMMWSIIAGFSESLVPSILSTTGRYLEEARK